VRQDRLCRLAQPILLITNRFHCMKAASVRLRAEMAERVYVCTLALISQLPSSSLVVGP